MIGVTLGSMVQQALTGTYTVLALDRSQTLALHHGDLGLQAWPKQSGSRGVGGTLEGFGVSRVEGRAGGG